MSKFKVIEFEQDKYSACIVIQTHESLYEIKKDLSHVVNDLKCNGVLLLDTLLHSGNADDRFLEMESNNGEIDWTTVSVATISKKNCIRKIIAATFKGNPELIDNSILTSIQKKMISRGIGI